jgi:hypothetical protein
LTKCRVCSRESPENSEYCEVHAKVYENIVHKYGEWKKALDISWEDYLSEILKNPLTGVWAKEVVQQLLKKEDPNDGGRNDRKG